MELLWWLDIGNIEAKQYGIQNIKNKSEETELTMTHHCPPSELILTHQWEHQRPNAQIMENHLKFDSIWHKHWK